jgi:hypothetical protein
MNSTSELSDFQDDFIRAIYGGMPQREDLAAAASQPGFAVYRNTILKSCIDNLAANFPTVLRLVGDTWFRAAALEHVLVAPPQQVSLFDYGHEFPAFLADFAPAAELPYLADVARLDRMWIAAHTAADAPPLGVRALAGIAPDALGAICLLPHPGARWACFDSHPAYAIWSANRALRELDSTLPWKGDGALLTRVDGVVQWQPLEAGAAAFLDACAARSPLADAAEHALSVQPTLDIAVTLALLIQAGAFIPFPLKTAEDT